MKFMYGIRAAGLLCSVMSMSVQAGVIFQDNFDNQPDYDAMSYISANTQFYADQGDPVPVGWSAVSSHPPYPKSNFQILAANADKARGGVGKSLVLKREGYKESWNSDAELAKNFDPGYDQMYVSFWIKIDPNWTEQGQQKVFRIGSYAPNTKGGDYWSMIGMGFIWKLDVDPNYGLRNFIYLHGSPGVSFSDPNFGVMPSHYNGKDAINLNYTTTPYYLYNSSTVNNSPNIVDQLTGKIIPNDPQLITSVASVFGAQWHHMEFYVRTNSAPGMQDGVLAQWMDGNLIFANKTVPWIQSGGDPSQKFTAVKFGGNSFFTAYPDSAQVTEWYAFDDVVIRDDLPQGKSLSPGFSPKPPSSVTIQ